MKKIISFLLFVAVIVAATIIVPKLVHKCDDCGNFFVGTGYEPNVVETILSEEEQIICKGCAEEQHALAIVMGDSVNDFKKPLFE